MRGQSVKRTDILVISYSIQLYTIIYLLYLPFILPIIYFHFPCQASSSTETKTSVIAFIIDNTPQGKTRSK